VFAKAIVPEVVIGPPVKPAPVSTEVTDPAPVGIVAQQIPSGAVEHAIKSCPFVPTGNAVGVFGAVPVKMLPLAKTHAQGIASAAKFAACLTALAVAASVVDVLLVESLS
jgi:hypothetical protein